MFNLKSPKIFENHFTNLNVAKQIKKYNFHGLLSTITYFLKEREKYHLVVFDFFIMFLSLPKNAFPRMEHSQNRYNKDPNKQVSGKHSKIINDTRVDQNVLVLARRNKFYDFFFLNYLTIFFTLFQHLYSFLNP